MIEPNIELGVRRWLARSLSWEARLRALRTRADLAATGHWDPDTRREPPNFAFGFRPSITGWVEELDRTA